MDVSPFNSTLLSASENDWGYISFGLWSAKHEQISLVMNKNCHYKKLRFLDEYRIAAASCEDVGFWDTRKLDKGFVESVSLIEISINFLTSNLFQFKIVPKYGADLVLDTNQRFILVDKNIVSIWDLNTCKWTGGFHLDNVPLNTHLQKCFANAKYFSFQQVNTASTNVLDFTT